MTQPRPENDKPDLPLEEMVDRGRKARGQTAGEENLSSAEKAPAPPEDALPVDEPEEAKEIDLAEADRPPQGLSRDSDAARRSD